MTVKSVEELTHIAACDILGYAVALTDLLGDACFVIFALQEFKNLGTYQVQAKHLAVVNVEQNRAVLSLRAAYVVRDSEHGLMGELAIPFRCRLWLQREKQSTHIYFCSERNRPPSKSLLQPWDRAGVQDRELAQRSHFGPIPHLFHQDSAIGVDSDSNQPRLWIATGPSSYHLPRCGAVHSMSDIPNRRVALQKIVRHPLSWPDELSSDPELEPTRMTRLASFTFCPKKLGCNETPLCVTTQSTGALPSALQTEIDEEDIYGYSTRHSSAGHPST